MRFLPEVLIIYNEPVAGEFFASDAGVLHEVAEVSASLRSLGVLFTAASICSLTDLPAVLQNSAAPVVFNLVEELRTGVSAANSVPAICEAFGKSCTGSDGWCLALTLHKAGAKAILATAGLPVPAGAVVLPGAGVSLEHLTQLPSGECIVKPLQADASEGIDAATSIFDRDQYRDIMVAVQHLQLRFNQGGVMIEQLVGRRELNVAVWRRRGVAEVVGIAEIDFSAFAPQQPRIVDYAAKWLPESFAYNNTPRILPAPLTSWQTEMVGKLALRAWDAVGGGDYGRVDMRMDDDGNVWILEINANPDIAPDAGYAAALEAAHISYPEFVATLVENAWQRHTHDESKELNPVGAVGVGATARRLTEAEMVIRYTVAADREAIVGLVERTGFFAAHEVDIAAEVVASAIAGGAQGDYQSFTAILEEQPVGWICFGATPCTEGTFDIYWIAVDANVQGRGVGRALMADTCRRIERRGGRLIIIETAGKAKYEATRQFYLRLGCREAARIPDFYAPGDDKVVYTVAPSELAGAS